MLRSKIGAVMESFQKKTKRGSRNIDYGQILDNLGNRFEQEVSRFLDEEVHYHTILCNILSWLEKKGIEDYENRKREYDHVLAENEAGTSKQETYQRKLKEYETQVKGFLTAAWEKYEENCKAIWKDLNLQTTALEYQILIDEDDLSRLVTTKVHSTFLSLQKTVESISSQVDKCPSCVFTALKDLMLKTLDTWLHTEGPSPAAPFCAVLFDPISTAFEESRLDLSTFKEETPENWGSDNNFIAADSTFLDVLEPHSQQKLAVEQSLAQLKTACHTMDCLLFGLGNEDCEIMPEPPTEPTPFTPKRLPVLPVAPPCILLVEKSQRRVRFSSAEPGIPMPYPRSALKKGRGT